MVPCSQAGAKISRYGRRGGCSLARGHESALHSRIVNFNSLFGSGIALGVVGGLGALSAVLLLAVLPEFYLRANQQPGGWDLRELSGFAGPPGRIQHPTESREP